VGMTSLYLIIHAVTPRCGRPNFAAWLPSAPAPALPLVATATSHSNHARRLSARVPSGSHGTAGGYPSPFDGATSLEKRASSRVPATALLPAPPSVPPPPPNMGTSSTRRRASFEASMLPTGAGGASDMLVLVNNGPQDSANQDGMCDPLSNLGDLEADLGAEGQVGGPDQVLRTRL
jgi:hypothetical protein